MKKLLLSVAITAAVAGPVWAAEQTITLAVPSMTCSVCPITVKDALSKVPGVEKIDVSLAKKDAVVTFDNAKTNTQALIKATTDAGYPSSVEQ